MGALYWKDTTGAADVCKAVTDCAGTNGHATPVTRVQVDAATATADRTCTPCSNGFWAAAGDNTNCVAVAMKCGDQVAVGGAAPVMREITSVATITADIGCGACASGSFPSSATGATYTCTSAPNSQISACKALYWKDTTGAADVCKAVTDCAGTNGHATPVTRIQVNAATATADRTCTPCSAGFWAAAGDNTNCAAVTMKCGDQV